MSSGAKGLARGITAAAGPEDVDNGVGRRPPGDSARGDDATVTGGKGGDRIRRWDASLQG